MKSMSFAEKVIRNAKMSDLSLKAKCTKCSEEWEFYVLQHERTFYENNWICPLCQEEQ